MTTTLGDAMPYAISKIGELIGAQEAMADQLDEVMPGSASGTRGVIAMLRSLLARAVLAQASGDVVETRRRRGWFGSSGGRRRDDAGA
jgi:hypothetical protein